MEVVQNEVVSGQTFALDEKHFVRCRFSNCTLIYSGGECSWDSTTFENCRVQLTSAAQRTAVLLGNFGVLPPGGNLPGGTVPPEFGFPKPGGNVQ